MRARNVCPASRVRKHVALRGGRPVLLFALVAWALAVPAVAGNHVLFEDASSAKSAVVSDSTLPAFIRARAVAPISALGSPGAIAVGDTLDLKLFNDASFNATVDRVSVDVNGAVQVRGRLADFPLGHVLISTVEGRSLGSIDIPELGAYYQIQFGGESEAHYLAELDPNEKDELEESPPAIPEDALADSGGQKDAGAKAVGDPQAPATIDVMIVYTPAARAWANANRGGIANVISQAMGRGQVTLDNSQTGVTLSLVHTAEVNYTESGCADLDLRRLTASASYNPYIGNYYCNGQTTSVAGYMDEIHAWRDQYGADLVALFEMATDTGGIAWQLYSNSGTPQSAFSISRVQQVDSTFTTIHELAHTMGCGHNRDQNFQPGPGLYSYSAGGRWVGTDNQPYASVMTYPYGQYYADGVSHSAVAYLSNPSVNFKGTPTGDAVTADNARTLREIKHAIAAYRSSGNVVLSFQTDGTPGAILVGITTQSIPQGGAATGVTAIPPIGGTFTGWTAQGIGSYSTSNPLVVTGTSASLSLTAHFTAPQYTLKYTSGTNGSLSGATMQTVNHGGSGTAVTAIPNAGFRFVQWSDGKTSNPRTDTNVTSSLDVNAQYGPIQYTLTYTSGTNGSLSGTTVQTVNQGGSGTAVTANPNAGFRFVQWSDGKTSNPRTDTNVTSSLNVNAQYTPIQYTLTYTSGTNGSLSGVANQTVNYGGSGTAVTALPNAGFRFVQWSDGKTSNPRTDTNVSSSLNVNAKYGPNQYTLTYTSGTNGSLSGAAVQTVAYGGNGTSVTALPNTGFRFVQWSDGVTSNPRADTNVTSPLSVEAQYGPNQYTLTYTSGTNGSLSGAAVQTVAYGGSGTSVTAIPNAGFRFVQWSDGKASNPRTDTDVSSSLNVKAQYGPNQYTLTYIPGTNGSLSGATVQPVNYGGNGTEVTALSNAGYHFAQWSDGKTSNPRTDTNVKASLNVTAQFVQDSVTLTYGSAGNGVVSGPSPQTVVIGGDGAPVTAVPNTGYGFTKWSDGSTANPRTDLNVTSPLFVQAQFAQLQVEIRFTAEAHGYIQGPGLQTVNYGHNGTPVTAVPDSGYHFVNWSDGNSTNPRIPRNVTEPYTVSARFALGLYTLLYDAGANGAVLGPLVQSVAYGESGQPVTAIAAEGWHFVAWSDGRVDNPRADELVAALVDVTAMFAINEYMLEYMTDEGGTISGEALQTVDHGSSGSAVEAVPNEGQTFAGWSDGVTANPRVDADITESLSVTAQFTANEYRLSYGAGENGVMSGEGVQMVSHGSDGSSVGIVPNDGYTFFGWSDGVTDNPRVDANVTGPIDVVATYAIKTYTLSYTSAGGGTVTGETVQEVPFGGSGAPVLAVAEPHYVFAGWSDGPVENPRTDSAVAGPLDVTALFALERIVLRYSADDGGTLSGDVLQEVDYGADGTAVSAEANEGFHFSAWSDGLTDNPRTDLSVGTAIDVTARFARNVYTLRYGAGEHGALNGETVQQIEYGGDGSAVTATPDPGHHFAAWSDGLTENPRTDRAIAGDLDVSAAFAPNRYLVTYSAGAHGSVTGETSQEIVHGGAGSAVTAVPDTGYRFDGWSDGAIRNPRADIDITGAIAVTAKFAPVAYTLTYTADQNGSLEGGTIQQVLHGENGQSVTAVAAPGYRFDRWSDGVTDNPRIDENLSEGIAVTAFFVSNRVTLRYSAEMHGAIAGEPVQTVTPGTDGTPVTAVAHAHYRFVDWSDGRTDNPRTDTAVSESITVRAHFAPEEYSLTYEPGVVGFIEGTAQQMVPLGGSGSPVQAVAPEGYHFVSWSDGSIENPRIDSDIAFALNVSANFAINEYALAYTAGAHGRLEGVTSQTVTHGADGQSVTAVPGEGYRFDGWSDGVADNPRIDRDVTATITASATFAVVEVAYVEPVPLCDLLAEPDIALMAMREAFGVSTDDLEGLGLPDEAALAVMDVALCDGTKGVYSHAAVAAYGANIALLDGPLRETEFYAHRDILALVTISSSYRIEAVLALLDLEGVTPPTGTLVTITCEDGECSPVDDMAKQPSVEPFAADGDLDGDGVANVVEYANIVADHGDILQFARAATDPLSDGIVPEQVTGCSSAGRGGGANSGAGDVLALLMMASLFWARRRSPRSR